MNTCEICGFTDIKSKVRRHIIEKHKYMIDTKDRSNTVEHNTEKYESQITLNCIKVVDGKKVYSPRQKKYHKLEK